MSISQRMEAEAEERERKLAGTVRAFGAVLLVACFVFGLIAGSRYFNVAERLRPGVPAWLGWLLGLQSEVAFATACVVFLLVVCVVVLFTRTALILIELHGISARLDELARSAGRAPR